MPGMNGYEFVRSVRETHPDLPVVLFTVTSAAEAWERARAVGATDHVEKGSPDQYARLADVIERTGG